MKRNGPGLSAECGQSYSILEIINIFYNNYKDRCTDGKKGQKQVKAATQWSINQGPYM